MARHFDNWLRAFVEYASIGEAPLSMYFWSGVSSIAGALRRAVWIDQGHFKWLPNFYILLVAKAGVVSKTTTADISMSLLKQVKGINFGPNAVTWQALSQALEQCTEGIQMHDGTIHLMSAITISSGELGNLLNPTDREMVDLLITLWDGKEGAFIKLTKTQGKDTIINPFINIIACTTPEWLSGNFPEYMIGGGFTSRCIFVHAEEKRQYVAYLDEAMPANFVQLRQFLIEDLTEISKLRGAFSIAKEARDWGKIWYEKHYKNRPAHLDNERFSGYIARKQTHIHKLAMILSAAEGDSLTLEQPHLEMANQLVTSLEESMPKVFDRIGRTEESKNIGELFEYIKLRKRIEYKELFRAFFRTFPNSQAFENALLSGQRAGLIDWVTTVEGSFVVWKA